MDSNITQGIIFYLIFIISGSLHEFAHAFSAYRLGDMTAHDEGRMTINPMVHIDFIGTVVFPMIAIFSNFPAIGWMKPVPIMALNFKHPRKGIAVTSFAGPFMNLMIAFVFSLLLMLFPIVKDSVFETQNPLIIRFFSSAFELIGYVIIINLLLAFFNLLPIPPLDGGGIIQFFIPQKWESMFYELQRYGFIILYILILTGVFGNYYFPYVFMLYSLIISNPLINLILVGLWTLILSVFIWRTSPEGEAFSNASKINGVSKEVIKDFERAKYVVERLRSGNGLSHQDQRWIEKLIKEAGDDKPLCSPYSFYPSTNTICKDCPNISRCLLRYIEMEGNVKFKKDGDA